MMKLDHLVYAVPNIERSIGAIRNLFGIEPTVGGAHVGFGTRNVLFALGDDCYFEVIGPDLSQPEPEKPRPFGLDELTRSRLVTWAVKAPSIDQIAADAKAAGYDTGPIEAMSRAKPDGSLLAWRLTRSGYAAGDGLVPFLIDWADTPSIAPTLAQGCRLIELSGTHPEPDKIQQYLKALGVSLSVEQGDKVYLTAVIEAPTGRVKLS